MTIVRSLITVLAGASIVAVAGCSKNSSSPLQSSFDTESRPLARVTAAYGTPQVVTLYAGQTIPVGTVTVMNDGVELTVVYETTGDWYLSATHLHIATSVAGIPQTKTGNPKNGNFAYKHTLDPVTQQDEYSIDLAANGYAVGTELYIAAHAVVGQLNQDGWFTRTETGWGAGTRFSSGNWATYFTYVIQAPPPPRGPETAEILPGDFRTQTQGGWGSEARGGNPGSYRDAHFAAAFPAGLVVGGPNTVTFTTSAAVEAALPTGGTAAPLAGSYINPIATEAGVLLGQVTALTLSVNFDLADPNFGASNVNLKDLVVVSGPFAGKTVAFVLAEANKILGGAASAYTVSQVNEAVSAINENFVDGTINNGYLALP